MGSRIPGSTLIGDRGHGQSLAPWPTMPVRFARSAMRSVGRGRRPAVRRRLARRAGRAAARDPHNVVHLTLASSEEEAGRRFRDWLDEGVLVEDAEPALWALRAGLRRAGRGRADARRASSPRCVSSRTRRVPSCRTSGRTPAPKESRLRLLRAARAQLEPIFLLYDGEPPLARPGPQPGSRRRGLPRSGGCRTRTCPEFFADRQLLIADGHHRYETAVAYHDEQGTPESGRLLAVLVSTADPGLEIFPTHRVFAGAARRRTAGVRLLDLEDALERLARTPYERAVGGCLPRRPRGDSRRGARGELDVELVDRYGHDGISYTPDWQEAVARVDARRGGCRLPAPADAHRGRLRAGAPRRGAAAEDDVLLSQAPLRPALPPARRASESLARACAGVRRGHPAASSATCRRASSASPCCAAGEGGDDTTAIDAGRRGSDRAPARAR